MHYNFEKIHYKKSLLYGILFFISSVYCMDQTSLVNCGLVNIFIPKDLILLIKSYCSFQDIGRLKSLNKAAYNYWDMENCYCSLGNLSFACQRLKKCPYSTRTKVLAHYAEQENRIMFQHIWSWQPKLRNNDLRILYFKSISGWNLEAKMAKYCTCYNSPEKRDEVYCKQVINAIYCRATQVSAWARNVLKQTLPGTDFNIYESPYRKKRAHMNGYYRMSQILFFINLRKDTDFLLAIIGGSIQANMFKSLYKHLSFSMLNTLDDRELIPLGEDKYRKSAAYYKEKMIAEQFPAQYISSSSRIGHGGVR